MIDRSPTPSSIGRRIAVIGNTGSGKSTLAERWPRWSAYPSSSRMRSTGSRTGSVSTTQTRKSSSAGWRRPLLQTAIWLDPPLSLIVWRVLSRSWGQLAVWKKADSLLWWALTQHRVKRVKYLSMMDDPQWGHVRFVRLRSVDEVEAFVASIRAEKQ